MKNGIRRSLTGGIGVERRRIAGILIVLTFGGAILRSWSSLMDWPLALDEIWTWRSANFSWGGILLGKAHPDHPPLSFLIVKFAMWIFSGDQPWILRFPSWLFGVAAIPAAYLLGRLTWSQAAGVAFAFFLAFDRLLIAYGWLARMYSLLVLLELLGLYLWIRAHREGRLSLRRALLLGSIFAAAGYAHHLGAVVWMGCTMAYWVEVKRGYSLPRARLALGLGGIGSLAGLLCALGTARMGHGPGVGLAEYLGVFVRPLTYFACFGYFALLGWRQLRARERMVANTVLSVMALNFLMVFIAAYGRPYAISRFLIPSQVLFLYCLAVFCVTVPRKRALQLARLAIIVVTIARLFPLQMRSEMAQGEIAQAVSLRAKPHDVVMYYPPWSEVVGKYYRQKGGPPQEGKKPEFAWIVFSYRKKGDPGEIALVREYSNSFGLAFDEQEYLVATAHYKLFGLRIDPSGIHYLFPNVR